MIKALPFDCVIICSACLISDNYVSATFQVCPVFQVFTVSPFLVLD